MGAAGGELKTLVDEAVGEKEREVRGQGEFVLSKPEETWRDELDFQRYNCLRRRGTEPPGSSEYDQFYPEKGHFGCGACSLPLYSASSKFKSSCGWPVFSRCYHSEEIGCHVATRSDGSGSLEILCQNAAVTSAMSSSMPSP